MWDFEVWDSKGEMGNFEVENSKEEMWDFEVGNSKGEMGNFEVGNSKGEMWDFEGRNLKIRSLQCTIGMALTGHRNEQHWSAEPSVQPHSLNTRKSLCHLMLIRGRIEELGRQSLRICELRVLILNPKDVILSAGNSVMRQKIQLLATLCWC